MSPRGASWRSPQLVWCDVGWAWPSCAEVTGPQVGTPPGCLAQLGKGSRPAGCGVDYYLLGGGQCLAAPLCLPLGVSYLNCDRGGSRFTLEFPRNSGRGSGRSTSGGH